MEVLNCVDINGVALNEVKFNVDGTVMGVLIDNQGTSNLSYDCCTAQGWAFDPTDTKCYWAESCLTGSSYNIVLDPQGNTGVLFQVDEYQKDKCHLELEFDWLLKFDCTKIGNSFKNLLENLKLNVNLEKVIYDVSLPIPNNLATVNTKPLFDITNIFDYFNNNENTGILLGGTNCSSVKQNFINDLGGLNESPLNENSINSGWVKFKMVVDDPNILESIYNERIKFSIQGNNLIDFSILMDNVKLNRVCEIPKPPKYLDGDCPKFELRRIIDNKKSWVSKTELEVRTFDLNRRQTKYPINHEKLSINTKEIDLAINTSQAVNNNTFKTIIENPCLLEPATGCTSGVTVTNHKCVDLSKLITKDLTEIIDENELLNMLIDAKSRKTISAYPVIELLYHRYKYGFEHCGVDTNSLDMETLDSFVDLLGTYWVDLIEQLVPATTIWGSSMTNSNNSFSGIGNNKFKYKKYTLFPCDTLVSYSLPSPTNVEVRAGEIIPEIEVIVEDITNILIGGERVVKNIQQTCTKLSIKQINDGSEFVGTVTVIGDGEGPNSGTTISITETIDDECKLFEHC